MRWRWSGSNRLPRSFILNSGMSLSFTDKLGIFIRQPYSWSGLIFGLGGIILVAVFLPNTDIYSYRFQQTPPLIAEGNVIITEETDCSDGETPISVIYYRYRAGNQTLVGSSYSSTLSAKPHNKVLVEYVAEYPYYSRIKGTTNAPFSLWVLLFLSAFIALGFSSVIKGFAQTKQLVAIVTDALVAKANREQMRSYDKSDYTVYQWYYHYQYAATDYTHVFESDSPEGFGATEEILVQRNTPSNAVLMVNLPRFVRERLGSCSVS
jgi:hypothetical protein